MNKIKEQTLNLTIPSGTTDGTIIEASANLDSNYDKCVGFSVQEVANSASSKYELGLRNEQAQIQDFTNSNHLIVSTAVAPKDRYHERNFIAQGSRVTVQGRPSGASAGADIKVQIIFKLLKD